MERPTVNKEALDLIKEFEGLRLKAYIDPVGVPTIGYGLTTGAIPGVEVRMGMTITEEKAEEYLTTVVERFADQIWRHFKRQPSENEFGAMVSLAYNIGVGAFSSSTALRRFNQGDTEGAAEAMKWWNKGTVNGRKVVLRGLTRRRAAEVKLFLKDDVIPADIERVVQVEEAEPVEERMAVVVDDADKTTVKSTTNWAAVGQAASAVGVPGVLSAVGDMDWKIAVPLMVAGVGLAVYIIRERNRKAKMAREAKGKA